MKSDLSTLEEFDIIAKLQFPHTLPHENMSQKTQLARYISSKKPEDLLLITPSGFSVDFIFAGIGEKQIEFVAANAPDEYKKELATLISNSGDIADIFAIAKAMDREMGENVLQNQQRVARIIQYIKDNQAIFQF